ncbi:MAG: M20/M25/M40 family metallo-hydrolase [Limnochordales bacterium]|nr:M20/M25/M40 family metallo-hydrolase [Limnochordales bacterium]
MQRRREAQSLRELLLELARARGGAGAETPVARLVTKLAAPWVDACHRDQLGNLWLIRRPRREAAGPRIMLAAHMDEIGWLVSSIEDGGFLRLRPLGGPDVATYLGHEVLVENREGRLFPGIVGTKPPHITRADEYRRFPEAEALFVDVGLSEAEVRQHIQVGDIVYPAVEPWELGEGRITAKSLDNRASVATVLWALRLLQDRDTAAEVVAVATVQEELGMRGARVAATSIEPDLAIALDVGFGLQPGVDRWTGIRLGKGPALTVGPNIHPGLRQALLDTARRIRVETQVEVAAGSTGTDAWLIQVAGRGIPTALLSLPLRYMHSAVELVDVGDLEETARLLAEFIVNAGPEWRRTRPRWLTGGEGAAAGIAAAAVHQDGTGKSADEAGDAGKAGEEGDAAEHPAEDPSADRSARIAAGLARIDLDAAGHELARRLVAHLAELSELRGPSGAEAPVREWLLDHLPREVDEVFIDSMGNLLVARGLGRPGPRVMVDAHMDEVGLIVQGVDDDGLLRIDQIGGIDPRVLPAQRVLVGPRALPGVIGVKPIHLRKGEERSRAPQYENLYVDIGAKDKDAAEKLVQPGETITFATRFELIGNGLVKGKALDDRGGCAILLELLAEDWPFPFFAAFTVQEEVGLRGAQVAAEEILPDVGLALETTICADLPDVPGHGQATHLWGGPAISFQDRASVADRELVELIEKVAAREGIPWQWRRALGGGNDAGAIQQRAGGARTCSISIPCRYIHTPACLLSVVDMVNTYRLARAFLRALATEWPRS